MPVPPTRPETFTLEVETQRQGTNLVDGGLDRKGERTSLETAPQETEGLSFSNFRLTGRQRRVICQSPGVVRVLSCKGPNVLTPDPCKSEGGKGGWVAVVRHAEERKEQRI